MLPELTNPDQCSQFIQSLPESQAIEELQGSSLSDLQLEQLVLAAQACNKLKLLDAIFKLGSHDIINTLLSSSAAHLGLLKPSIPPDKFKHVAVFYLSHLNRLILQHSAKYANDDHYTRIGTYLVWIKSQLETTEPERVMAGFASLVKDARLFTTLAGIDLSSARVLLQSICLEFISPPGTTAFQALLNESAIVSSTPNAQLETAIIDGLYNMLSLVPNDKWPEYEVILWAHLLKGRIVNIISRVFARICSTSQPSFGQNYIENIIPAVALADPSLSIHLTSLSDSIISECSYKYSLKFSASVSAKDLAGPRCNRILQTLTVSYPPSSFLKTDPLFSYGLLEALQELWYF